MSRDQKLLVVKVDSTPWKQSALICHDNFRNPYIGKDGNSYQDSSDLKAADEEWRKSNLFLKGKDGKAYPSHEDLRAADDEWKKLMFSKIHQRVA